MYSYHIQFADGSNPYYHFPTTYKRHYDSVSKWKRLFALTEVGRERHKGGGFTIFYTAKERG